MMFQIPPTPTPIPFNPASPAYDLDLSPVGGLWERAPNVVGLWNQFPDAATTGLQWVILGLILLVLIVSVLRIVKNFADSEDV